MSSSREHAAAETSSGRGSGIFSRTDVLLVAVPPVLLGLSLSATYHPGGDEGAGRDRWTHSSRAGAVHRPDGGDHGGSGIADSRGSGGHEPGHYRPAASAPRGTYMDSVRGDRYPGGAEHRGGRRAPYLVSPLLDTVVGLCVLLLLVFAIGVAGWLDVLLGGLAGLSAAMAISLLLVFAASAAPFRRLDIAMLACALGFVFGALVVRFARSRPRERWIWLAIGTLLNLGTLANIEDVVLRKWRLTHSQTGPAWILPVGMVAMMVFGPVLGLVARTFRRRRA